MNNKKLFTASLVSGICLAGPLSHAFAASSSTSMAGAGGLWIAFAIAYLTRKRAFGGWLFYYYFQLYGSLAVTVLLMGVMSEDFRSSGWEDKAMYSLFLISVIPHYVLKASESLLASALFLRRCRSQKVLNYLRLIILAQVVVSGVSLFIDYNHFPDNLPITVLSLVFSIIWLLYFTNSFRVHWVLAHPGWEWNYEAFRQKPAKTTI
jgi:hypothetical protein